jgi:hypothetical protein
MVIFYLNEKMSVLQSHCFISDSRACKANKIKNTVFIIGSGSSEFKKEIDEIEDVLDGFNLKGYFALLSEKEKGLDAFCDKICSKIKEAKFCVVLLNNPILRTCEDDNKSSSDSIRAPSANVYYEFGIAIALGKPVIPIIRSGLRLPFDVQHLDSIIYTDLSDLKKKLKNTILPTLEKKKPEFKTNNIQLVDHIYGPLYNEISRFLSKKDKLTTFNPSRYHGILGNSRHWFDTLEKNLKNEIIEFYDDLEKFNTNIEKAKRVIQKIVANKISNLLNVIFRPGLTISVNIKSDVGQSSPSINQILLRKTTPEKYFETVNANKRIISIEYILESPNGNRHIDSKEFKTVFDRCHENVERSEEIIRMRNLEEKLKDDGEKLKKKIFHLCNQ